MKEIKNFLPLKGKSVVIQFVIVAFILFGLAAGIILVQQNQEYREKAVTDLCNANTNVTDRNNEARGGTDCAWYSCSHDSKGLASATRCWTRGKNTQDVCRPYGESFTTNCSGCYRNRQVMACQNNTTQFCDCRSDDDGYECEYRNSSSCGQCPTNIVCNTSGGGGGGGGTTTTCGFGSASSCQGLNPGDSCGQGKECKDTGQIGSDGKPKCSCTQTGGGGGSPTPGSGQCQGAKRNPGTFTAGKTGKLTIYYHVQGTQGRPFQVAVKPNATTCSLTDNSGVFNLTESATGKMETNLDVVSGQSVCFGIYYNQSSAAQYQDATSNSCGGSLDITPNVTQAETENGTGSISSKQCWANSLTECDFNDFAILFAIGGESSSGGLSFKLRFQGITKLANNQLIDTILLAGTSTLWEADEVEISNDQAGVYTLTVPSAIASGTYNLLVKGHSHLQKRFTNVVYNGGDETIDLSGNENFQMRAGDVTDDNSITIEDVSRVLSFYTDFSIIVDNTSPEMVASDIDKNGKITIQDIALIAINWSGFRVNGDE